MLHNVNLETGWVDYPRPKTGIARRCPLWPETIVAIRAAVEKRPKPAGHEDCGRVFLTQHGTAWVRLGEVTRSDYVSFAFKKHAQKLKLHRKGLGFYTLRHVFRTVADAIRDPVAIDTIMGHADPSMGAHYRERIDDARLKAVTECVRKWLWPGGEATTFITASTQTV
jgi:integrase